MNLNLFSDVCYHLNNDDDNNDDEKSNDVIM